jgi:release factor glutamine methyltransferase
MILKNLFQGIKEKFLESGIETSALDARILFCHALKISHEQLLLANDRILTDAEINGINDLVQQRLDGMPVAKIIGEKEFYGRMFKTTTDTLDPRPDSETLIEVILKHYNHDQDIRILDLGTGTGCLALTLLAELPKARAIAVDQSQEALKVAKDNAWKIGVEDRIVFAQSNWFSEVIGSFDLIISNPPYIPESNIPDLSKEVRLYDPMAALVGGKDGLDPYRLIIPQSKTFLKPDGMLVFELGQGQDGDVAEMLRQSGFEKIFVKKDLAGISRVVGGFMLQKQPDSL